MRPALVYRGDFYLLENLLFKFSVWPVYRDDDGGNAVSSFLLPAGFFAVLELNCAFVLIGDASLGAEIVHGCTKMNIRAVIMVFVCVAQLLSIQSFMRE